MDVVYPLKVQHSNEELRYSLRSISRNLPHGRVWLSGHRPMWAANIRYIRGEKNPDKYKDALGNILRACAQHDLTDDFILMNDDFFVLRPQTHVEVFHRGPLKNFLDNFQYSSNYRGMMEQTLQLLRSEGYADPLFYGTHTPTVMNKRNVLELARRFDGARFMLRTVYHTIYGPEGTLREDVKKRSATDKIAESDYLSTSDKYAMTPQFRTFIRSRFRYPCYYECL